MEASEQSSLEAVGFGGRLRQARVEAGWSIGDIAAETKISIRLLEAFESESFEELPESVFCRNFLRQIAKLIGLDPETLIDDFFSAADLPPRPRIILDGNEGDRAPQLVALVALVSVAILVLASWWWFKPSQAASQGSTPPPVVTPVEQVEAAELQPTIQPDGPDLSEYAEPELSGAEVLVVAPTPQVQEVETRGGPQVFASEECWLRYRDATGVVREAILGPGDGFELVGELPIQLTLGNAGGVLIEIGGRRFTELGERGRVARFEISSEGRLGAIDQER